MNSYTDTPLPFADPRPWDDIPPPSDDDAPPDEEATP